MAIPIEKESRELFKQFHCHEQCVFCNKETTTWHKETNKPVCETCAQKHDVSELVLIKTNIIKSIDEILWDLAKK